MIFDRVFMIRLEVLSVLVLGIRTIMEPPPSTLCERCQVLEFDDSALGFQSGDESTGYFLQADRIDHEGGYSLDYGLLDSLPDLPILSESARRGCSFCSILRKATQECDLSKQNVFIRLEYCFKTTKYPSTEHHDLCALLAEVWAAEEDKYVYLLFSIDSLSGHCKKWLRMNSSPEETVLCPKNIHWIKECLENDLEAKDKRKEGAEDLDYPKYLPLRLLDLTPDGNYDCRLITTDMGDLPPDTQYLALSYCWGNQQDADKQFKTEATSINDRKRGFMDDSVPLCIRDAFKVTRTLGMRYLWVDALCIIQGDTEDWEKQSAQMANVFRGAYAVICAAASESCNQGFLERGTAANVRFQSRVNPSMNGHYNIRFHSVISAHYHANRGNDYIDISKCRWAIRGWTFQEERMAQRAIIFGKWKIHYIRKSLLWTENSEPQPDYEEEISTSTSIERLDDRNISGWLVNLDFFFGRQFSNPQDKLPAISGLATLASNGNPEEYLAGVRKSHLHRDLFCMPIALGDKRSVLFSLQSPDTYIAPSWSWASRQQSFYATYVLHFDLLRCVFPTDVRKEYSRVETQVSRVGHNPYGRVSDGRLKFSAVVVRLAQRLNSRNHGFGIREYQEEDFYARVSLDWDSKDADNTFFLLLGSYKSTNSSIESRSESSIDTQADKGKDRMVTDEDDEDIKGIIGQGTGRAPDEDDKKWEDDEDDEDDVADEDDVTPHLEEEITPLGNDEFSTPGHLEDTYQDRVAYGIIVHAALEPGEFYRVGVWAAPERNGSGGLHYFRDRQESTLTLI
ncbi:heterokaryon incompatibility protein-domain-containing protein [Pestalotiopsis sp. NC0098]|nr:heterokaryon incompatibility protein-domain-containing protein [Pestalotiopsis sp. NC0098]